MNNPLKLSNEQLGHLQAVLLEILIEIKRVCKLADIPYVIIAGTMLGSVRHGGFIPWDDDADVAMLRKDYDKFVEACKKYLDKDKFYFQDAHTTEGYRWGYGKVRRKESRFVVSGTEELPYEQGIWVDVFPLDYVPNSKLMRTAVNFHCFLIRKFLFSEAGKIREKNILKKKVYNLMSMVPLKSEVKYLGKYVKWRNRKRTKWVRILTFPTPNHEYGYLEKWYRKRAVTEFCGVRFAGIKEYDEYLCFKFGEYMKLPPPEMRKQHYVSEVKFPD